MKILPLRRAVATLFVAALAATPALTPAFAQDLNVNDAFARASGPNARAGAAFMVFENTGDTALHLIGASSEVAMRVELHTHRDMGEGVMQMVEIEGGITIEPGAEHVLQRGGDHVMLMGLNTSLNQGDMVEITLIFEHADEMTIEVPVDLTR